MLNKICINSKKQIVYILLILVTLVVFWQVRQFDFINLDDTDYITYNSHVQSGITLEGLRWAFSTSHAKYWHPLTWMSLMFDYKLFGLNAGGYHLTNVLLHILSTLLLFWLFNRMTGEIWKSAFVAAVFALHPLHVECVAWVAKRRDILSAFFFMLTLCLYVYYSEKPSYRRYVLVLFAFVCSLMSKPMTITLPIIMLLMDYWPLNRLRSKELGDNLKNQVFTNQMGQETLSKLEALKSNIFTYLDVKLSKIKFVKIIPLWQIKEKLPFFALSAVFSIITLYVHDTPEMIHFPYRSLFANAIVSFIAYLEKTFWPHDMVVLQLFPDQIPTGQVLGSILLIIIISIAVISFMKHLPYLFVGWFWYAITILPTLGIIQYGSLAMSDHHTYLPSIGIVIMLAWLIPVFFTNEYFRKKILFPFGIAAIAVLAFLTWQQCGYWKNSISLFSHAIQITKNNYMAHNNLGVALFEKNKFMDAIDHYDMAINIRPAYAGSYINRGNAYAKLTYYHKAIEDYNKAIRINPSYYGFYINRGNSYAKLGQYHKAIEDCNKAIQLMPNSVEPYYNRGTTYGEFGLYQNAIDDFEKVLSIDPANVDAYYNRGIIYAKLGRYPFAIKDFNKVIDLKPDYSLAYHSRAVAYLFQGNHKAGCRDAQIICEWGNCQLLELAKSKGYCR